MTDDVTINDDFDKYVTPATPAARAPKSRPEVDYRQLYNDVGTKYGVDPDLLYNQAKHESVNFNPNYVYGPGRSPKGAAGIAQFMPDTARQYGLKVQKGQDDRFNPTKAADAHGRLMRDLIDKYGDPSLALSAYNSGTNKTPAQAARAMQRIPETRNYVQKLAPQDDFDKYVSTAGQQPARPTTPEAQPNDDFEKYVTQAQQPAAQPEPQALKSPQVTSTVKEADTGTELPSGPTPQPKPVAPVQFQQGTGLRAPTGIADYLATKSEIQQPRSAAQEPGAGIRLPFSPHVTPSRDEIERAVIRSFGPQYESLNNQYRKDSQERYGQAENLVKLPESVKQEPDGSVIVGASKGAVDFLNAYAKDGIAGVEALQKPGAHAFQAAPPKSTMEKIGDAGSDLLQYLNIDTPGGLKSDFPRGVAHAVTLGAVGEPREISREEKILNPQAEATANLSRGVGEAAGALLPFVAAGKILAPLELARPVQTAAQFGLVDAGKQAVNLAKGRPVDWTSPIVSAGIGTAIGHLEGADPSVIRKVVAFIAPQLAVDAATGVPREQAIQNALTNMAFALGTGNERVGPDARTSEVQSREALGIDRAAKEGLTPEEREAKVQPYFLRDDQGNPVARVLNPDEVAAGGKMKVRPIHPADTAARDEGGRFAEKPEVLSEPLRQPVSEFAATEAPQVAPTEQQKLPVPQTPEAASVPFMITRDMQARLGERGYSEADINKMTPQQANDILAQPSAAIPPSQPAEAATTQPVSATTATTPEALTVAAPKPEPISNVEATDIPSSPEPSEASARPAPDVEARIQDRIKAEIPEHAPAGIKRAKERLIRREESPQSAQTLGKEAGAAKLPQEDFDRLLSRGWDLYDQKIKPTFEEWAQKIKDEFGSLAEEHLKPIWNQLTGRVQEESSTAANKAKVDEERAARGVEPLPWSPETKADADLITEAKAKHEANPEEAADLVTALLKKPRAVSDLQTVQMDVYKQDLVNKHNELLKQIANTSDPQKLKDLSDRLDVKEQQFDDADRAWRAAGTEKGRSLRAQRITINQNYELLPMKARMKAATGDVKLPPEVEAKIEAQQKRIAELEDRWNKRVAANEEQAKAKDLEKVIVEKKIEIRRAGRKRAHDDLVKERADIKQTIAQAWAKMKPKSTTLSMGGLGDIDPEGELSRALGDLARNYIEDGVVKAADIVDAIHEQIKDVADLTKRQVSDLISGYGKVRESVRDPIERKLNEVKSILASTSGKADVLEQGIRPLRRGQQREKPTEDQRRALRELEDAMREKGPELAKQPYDARTEQASPLDKAKTTARNRQEQLKKWIADGKREVNGRQQIIPDAELKQLKAENVGLEKVVALLNDPKADQKAIELRVDALNRQIAKSRMSVASGKTSPQVREGAKSVWSPEIGALTKERAALSRIASDMRADEARKAREAEKNKPTGIYGVEGSWSDFEARAKKALAARKRFQQQIDEIQSRRAAGDFTQKPKTEPQVYDADTEKLRLEMNREKRKFDTDVFNAKIKKEWDERPWWSKGLAYGAAGVRAGVLSGAKTVGKIGSALAQRTGQQYLEEAAARGAKRLFPGTAEKATRYGGHMTGASEAAAAKGFGAGVKEIPRILATGKSELGERFSDRYPGIPTKLGRALEVPGRVHFAEKNPLLRAEFERSKELLLAKAERLSPGSRTNPTVIDAAEQQAYKNAKEVILMGDNPFSRRLVDAQLRMGKESKDLTRTIVPVHRVAGNYLNQMISEYGIGLLRGTVRALNERNPDALAKLTPEEADKTMRLIQRGVVGALYMALAGSGIAKFGGFYKRGRKDEVKPQDVKVGGVTIPHWALHSPPDELAQLIASMKQEWDEGKSQDKTKSQRLWSGVARSGKGVAGQVPFINELTSLTDSLENGDSLSGWAGRFVASRTEPQILQEIAKTTDKFQGDDVKRKPEGFTDAMKMGIPFARQTVPISKVFGARPTKASSEVQRLGITIEGVSKDADETPRQFALRQARVNPYVRKTLESVVSSPEYDKASDADKAEWLKQAAAGGRRAGEANEPEKPEKPEKKEFPIPEVPRPLSKLNNPFARKFMTRRTQQSV